MKKMNCQDLTQEEITGEIRFFLKEYLLPIVKSIKKINSLLDLEDCYFYIVDKLKETDKFKNPKHLFIWTKHRLINFYRKEKIESEKMNDFKNYYAFITEKYELEYEEIVAILLTVTPKFNKFLENTSFYSGKKLDYRKMKKIYSDLIEKNHLGIECNSKGVKAYIKNSFFESKFNIKENHDNLEYQDFRNYNSYNSNDYTFDDEFY